MTNPTPDQPTGMNELREILAKYNADNTTAPNANSPTELEAAVQQIVERCIPENLPSVPFEAENYYVVLAHNQAIYDFRHNLQQAGLLRGEDV